MGSDENRLDIMASDLGLRTRESASKLTKHQLGFAALCVISLLVGWHALADTFVLSLRDNEYTYLLLILPIGAALIFLEWRTVRPVVALNVRAGSLCLTIAALVATSTFGWPASLPSDVQLSTRILALVLWWIGAFILCFGTRASRSVLFPLCFLLGLIPLPDRVVGTIVGILQQGSAWAAHLLFAICGVPVAQEGVVLTIPGLSMHVAQECSSIRSSSMLLVITVVLAQLFLRSPWRKALVIGLAVPLSIAKNGLRIFTIAMLGTRVDAGYLTGRFHREGGIVFFLIVLIVLFAFLRVMQSGDDLSLEPSLSQVKTATIEG
jgi:exosortase